MAAFLLQQPQVPVNLLQALGRGELFLQQFGQFLLFGLQRRQVALGFRQFNFAIGDLGWRQALPNQHQGLRRGAIPGQDLAGLYPLP